MRHVVPKWIVLCSLVLLAFCGSQASEGAILQAYVPVPSTGFISYWPTEDVTVNISQVIGINNMSLGLQIDWEWKAWLDSPTLKELVRNADIGIIRFFDFRPTIPSLMPCVYWNENNQTGTWNWTNVDNFVQAIFAVGAEPLVCLGDADNTTQKNIPVGMTIDAITQLPHPDSYAKYCVEWVEHFKARGWSVRFYEIFNEPGGYFGRTSSVNLTKLEYFRVLWNSCARAMRAVNPCILASFSYIMWKEVLNYWLTNGGENVDFLDFHKYDSWTLSGAGYFDDAALMEQAEKWRLETTTPAYGVKDAKQIWFNSRGVTLPVICSESGLSSAFENGTDPRIQKTIGAVWTGLVLRQAVLDGLALYTYYKFGSYADALKTRLQIGLGYGMVDFGTDKPWYPYYVYQMIGNHLAIGDSIVESSCSSDNLTALSWIHNGSNCILVISRTDQPQTISVSRLGKNACAFQVMKIDNTFPWENATLNTYSLSPNEPLVTNGYAVTLLLTCS